ncbi:MAG: haloacid dehalogenase-like hydrolase [Planctomycetes bacterium]|nr:haloacid dehalogenase-like hydrolase [Planctomycetota bacterium]
MPQPQNIVGVVFDYDKTLSPSYMQEDAIFKRFGIEPKPFWGRTNALVADHLYESELAWMYQLLDHPEVAKLSNAELRAMGQDLKFYPGLPDALPQMRALLDNTKYREFGVQLEYYVVTSGLKELVKGSPLTPHLKAVFGCEFDERDGRLWRPKRCVSHTAKTQMLFRISKNLISMSEDVNVHMPHEQIRIPFWNMVYVGDGPTDVPCFAVVKNYGGKTIAVYDPSDDRAYQKCYELTVNEKRVDMAAEANYAPKSHLRRTLDRMILEIADKIVDSRR